MTRLNKFLGDDRGAVTIDWVALTAGILLLGIMVVYAIFNGGVAGIVTSINATLTDVAAGADTGAIPSLDGVEVASAGGGDGLPAMLATGTFLPVGSKVTAAGVGIFGPGVVVTSFITTDGQTFQTMSTPNSPTPLAVGTTISGSNTFTLDGTTTSSQGFLDNNSAFGPVPQV